MTMKHRRRALVLSVFALLLCVSMLVGTTFAWFTDSVTSGKNTITAGNLDVQLEFSRNMTDWFPVDGRTDLVDPQTKWEPGHTDVVYLRLSNRGTLAVKYRFSLNIYKETGSVNVDGEQFLLSDFLRYGVTEPTARYADRTAAVEAVEDSVLPLGNYSASGSMLPGVPDSVLALVVYMPESVGNKANHQKGADAPQIELGLELFATQLQNEEDSFGMDYDAGAPWTGEADTAWYDPAESEYVLTNAAQLAGFSALTRGVTTYSLRSAADFRGKTVKLGADIDLGKLPWTPVGFFAGVFDGQGHTVSNVHISGVQRVALFSELGGTVMNLKLAHVQAKGSKYVGAVAGYMCEAGGLENCHVQDAVIVAAPVMNGGVYDDGQHAGGLAGYADSTNVTGCSVQQVSVSAYRDFGGLVGTCTRDTTNNKPASQITGCEGSDIALAYLTAAPYADGTPNGNMAPIFGRGEAEVDDHTREHVGQTQPGGETELNMEFDADYVGHYYMEGGRLFASGLQFSADGDGILCVLQTHDFEDTPVSMYQRPIPFEGNYYYHFGAGFEPHYAEIKNGEVLVYNSYYGEKTDDVHLRMKQHGTEDFIVTQSADPYMPVGTILSLTSWSQSAPDTGIDYVGPYTAGNEKLYCVGVNLQYDEGGSYCAVLGHDLVPGGNVEYEGKQYGHQGAGLIQALEMQYQGGVITGTADTGDRLVLVWSGQDMTLTVTESTLTELPVGTVLTRGAWN